MRINRAQVVRELSRRRGQMSDSPVDVFSVSDFNLELALEILALKERVERLEHKGDNSSGN